MSALTHAKSGWAIGPGKPLAVIAGLNVLENKALALTVGAQLKAICAELGLPYVFKASFDKANRSSIHSYRGPGLEEGLQILMMPARPSQLPPLPTLSRSLPSSAGRPISSSRQPAPRPRRAASSR